MKQLPAVFFGIFTAALACLPQALSAQRGGAVPQALIVPFEAEPEPSNGGSSLLLPLAINGSWQVPQQNPGQKGMSLVKAVISTSEYVLLQPGQGSAIPLKNPVFDLVSGDPHGPQGLVYVCRLGKRTGLRFYSAAWGTRDFPFGSKSHSQRSPCMSRDGRTLYFASDQPGGLGGYDIWQSTHDGTSWTPPIPLPAPLNSPGNELNPVIQADGSLVLACRATIALDYDLFRWRNDSLTRLPYPINTVYDDLSMGTTSLNQRIWVCSTRPVVSDGAAGPVQLFRLTPKPALQVLVRNQRSGRPLAGIPVRISDGKEAATTPTGPDGRLSLFPLPTQNYQLGVYHPDYDSLLKKDVHLALKSVEIALTEREYWDLQLRFTEYSKPPVTPISYALYENGQRIDSLADNAAHFHYRRLRPGSAYLIHAYCGEYPRQTQTFNTRPANPTDSAGIVRYYFSNGRMPTPVKDPHNSTFNFGWPVGAYTSIQVKDSEHRKVADAQLIAYRDLQRLSDAQIPASDAQGSSWFRFEKNQRYLILATADGRIGYTELDTQSGRSGNDTLSATILLSTIGTGEPFLTIPRPEDPILLQAGKPAELQILLALLDAQPELRVALSGHADPSEGPQAQKKSKDAAEFAADFLFLHGIARDRVQVRAYGATRPRHAGDSDAARAGNKRVEVQRL
jgi:WD40-like Beta Propeller Repeat